MTRGNCPWRHVSQERARFLAAATETYLREEAPGVSIEEGGGARALAIDLATHGEYRTPSVTAHTSGLAHDKMLEVRTGRARGLVVTMVVTIVLLAVLPSTLNQVADVACGSAQDWTNGGCEYFSPPPPPRLPPVPPWMPGQMPLSPPPSPPPPHEPQTSTES